MIKKLYFSPFLSVKDKAEILLQVDESQSIKNELTIQVRKTIQGWFSSAVL